MPVSKFQFKFKDKLGKQTYEISNKAEPHMVIDKIVLHKVPGENNIIDVALFMPDLKNVTVVDKPIDEGENG
jgi:hypothetical protein